MYHDFILHTICHYLKRAGKISKDKHFNKMERLPQPVQKVLQQLQKVAFDGLVEDKIVFTMDDLPDMCKDDPTCYGLLQCTECYSAIDVGLRTRSFNFLHLGIQEYFAADYVASLTENKVNALLQETFCVNDSGHDADNKCVRLANMWILYCGIVGHYDNNHAVSTAMERFLHTYTNHLPDEHVQYRDPLCCGSDSDLYWSIVKSLSKESEVTDPKLVGVQAISKDFPSSIQKNDDYKPTMISSAILNDRVKVLYLFQCFQEANDDKMCQVLLNLFDDDEIDLSNHRLLPYQVVSLGFFLSLSCRKWKKLDLRSCHIGDHGMSLLCHYLCGDKDKDTKQMIIAEIILEHNDLTRASSPFIANIISYLHPRVLRLGYNSSCFAHEISTAITTSTVKVLGLISSKINTKELELLLYVIPYVCVLNLRSNRLGDEGAQLLSEGIKNTCTLKVLDVSYCGIYSKGVISLAGALSCNNTLQILSLDGNLLSLYAATKIAEAIKVNYTLKELYIESKSTQDMQLCLVILESLHHNHTITMLRLPDPYQEEVQAINDFRKLLKIDKLVVQYSMVVGDACSDV